MFKHLYYYIEANKKFLFNKTVISGIIFIISLIITANDIMPSYDVHRIVLTIYALIMLISIFISFLIFISTLLLLIINSIHNFFVKNKKY